MKYASELNSYLYKVVKVIKVIKEEMSQKSWVKYTRPTFRDNNISYVKDDTRDMAIKVITDLDIHLLSCVKLRYNRDTSFYIKICKELIKEFNKRHSDLYVDVISNQLRDISRMIDEDTPIFNRSSLLSSFSVMDIYNRVIDTINGNDKLSCRLYHIDMCVSTLVYSKGIKEYGPENVNYIYLILIELDRFKNKVKQSTVVLNINRHIRVLVIFILKIHELLNISISTHKKETLDMISGKLNMTLNDKLKVYQHLNSQKGSYACRG